MLVSTAMKIEIEIVNKKSVTLYNSTNLEKAIQMLLYDEMTMNTCLKAIIGEYFTKLHAVKMSPSKK